MKYATLIGLAFALATRVAAADEPLGPEQLYDQGQAAFDASQFDQAVSAWERSYALSNEPGLLFNIGQAYRQRGKPGDCAKALGAYTLFLALDPTSDQRPIAEGFAASMRTCVANALPIASIPAVEPPRDRGRAQRIAGIATAGGGLASLATGLYFGRRAASIGNDVTTACMTRCEGGTIAAEARDGKRDQDLQWVFYGVGAAATITGGVLYWLGHREDQPSIVVGVSPRDGGAAITWSGVW